MHENAVQIPDGISFIQNWKFDNFGRNDAFAWRMPGGRFHMERDNLIGAKRQNGIGRNA